MSGLRWGRAVLAAIAVMTMPAFTGAHASEGAVDLNTQAALALDAHPDRGAQEFSRYCAHCHGSKAEGDDDRAIPSLAEQRFAYLVRQLANFTGGERESNAMHGVLSREGMREPQTWVDIAAYLNRLPASHHAKTGDGRQIALGRQIFREQCASCHRADARGDLDGFVPSLRNQQFSYLTDQLHKLGGKYRHNVDEDLVRFLGGFDDQDVEATADYLSRLRGRGAVHRIKRSDGVVVD